MKRWKQVRINERKKKIIEKKRRNGWRQKNGNKSMMKKMSVKR